MGRALLDLVMFALFLRTTNTMEALRSAVSAQRISTLALSLECCLHSDYKAEKSQAMLEHGREILYPRGKYLFEFMCAHTVRLPIFCLKSRVSDTASPGNRTLYKLKFWGAQRGFPSR
jgi:hypothetical protein